MPSLTNVTILQWAAVQGATTPRQISDLIHVSTTAVRTWRAATHAAASPRVLLIVAAVEAGLQPSNLSTLEHLALIQQGAGLPSLAAHLGVSRQTLHLWGASAECPPGCRWPGRASPPSPAAPSPDIRLLRRVTHPPGCRHIRQPPSPFPAAAIVRPSSPICRPRTSNATTLDGRAPHDEHRSRGSRSPSLASGYDAAGSCSTSFRLPWQLANTAQAQSSMATRSSTLHSKMALRSARAEMFASMEK